MLNFLGLDLNSDCRFCDPAKHNFVRGVDEGPLMFAQLMQHLSLTTFRRCVTRYRGAFKVKNFSCLDQFLCMAFAQLTFRESLRDIEVCVRAQSSKLYISGYLTISNIGITLA